MELLRSNQRPTSGSVLIPVCTLSVLLYAYLTLQYQPLWDLGCYARAVADFNAGANPYRTDVGLPFIYHPFVLYLLVFLDRLAPLREMMIALYALSSAWFLAEAALWLRVDECRASATPHPQQWATRGLSLLLAAAAFGGVGVSAILSGNLTTFMHFAVIAALLRSLRKQDAVSRNLVFVLIPLLAIIKPYFIGYLLVPVMLPGRKPGTLARSFAAGAVFLAVWVGFAHLSPESYRTFSDGLRYESFHNDDLGYAFFVFFRRIVHNDWLALMLHCLTALALFFAAVKYLLPTPQLRRNPGLTLFLLYFVITLASPRMKEYDFFPALFCFFVYLNAVSQRSQWIVMLGLVFSWTPLLLNALKTFGMAFSSVKGASTTWQIIGLVILAIAFAFETRRHRLSDA